jgi:hypothetical protein
MQVFLVPVGATSYRLYVEMPDEDAEKDARKDPPTGRFSRLAHRFRTMLAEAEAERLRRERGETEQSSGIGRTIMRKVAETIAEQRLLWHLRHQTVVQLCHPPDLEAEHALHEVKSGFAREILKHRRWMIIDGLLVAITGPLFFFIPGPNVVSWYFTFRTVAHYLSWRGARKGVTLIEWRAESCAPLADVRQAINLPAADRRHRLEQISEALGLKHLRGFVERVSSRAV